MKKKTPQKAAVFFLSLSLLAGGFMASAEVRPADITITYDGSRTIQTSENDFFGEAGKNLMPGSSFTKEMDIVNDSEDDIVVYLKAEIGEDVYAKYLEEHPDAPEIEGKTYAEQLIKESPMTITALDRQGNPVEVYYKGPASGDPQHKDTATDDPGLTNRYPNTERGIVIGRLSDGATANLTFQVQVPTSLGNEYQDTFSLVKWILVCDATPSEEIPDDPPPIDGPDTGDSIFPAMTALLIAAASAVIMVFFFLLLVKSRKEKEKETAEVTNRVIR